MDFRLPWAAVDPRKRAPLDEEGARKRAGSALRRKKSRSRLGREEAEREVRFLVWSELGAWCEGWHDPVSAGGASRVWEGPTSVGEDDEATVSRVIEALEDWQAWLVALGERFDAIAEATAGLEDVDAVSRAAGELLPVVLERTGAAPGWPRSFAQTLGWCVQACGRAEDDVSARIEAAMEGAVDAGHAPEGADAQDLIDELALEIAVRERPPFTDDALEAWWEVRNGAPWDMPTPHGQRPAEGDGHRKYIVRVDRPRSAVTADAFTRALVRARYGATKKLKLDRALLEEWLELALASGDFGLRRGEAVSKDEAERYGRPADLERRLDEALTQATTEGTSAISRAARLYLDVTFLRPYTVGNDRLARLALDHVLTRGGLAMHDATPIVTIRRWAHEATMPWRFQRELAACVGPG